MRKTRPFLVIAVVFVATVASTDAWAQPEGGRRGPRGRGGFGGPGGAEPAEMARMMMRRFPILAALDADEDGEISSTEIENAAAALKSLDKDNDGKLTVQEMMPERGGRPPFGGPGFGRGAGGPGRGDRPNPEAMADRFLSLDKNGDEQLTEDEVPERMQSVFARADANEDKTVTREELIEMAKKQQEEGGRGPGPRGGFGRGRGGFGGGGRGGDRPQRPERPE